MLNSLFDSFLPTNWYSVTRIFRVWWLQSPASLIAVLVALALLMVAFTAGYLGGQFAQKQDGTPDDE